MKRLLLCFLTIWACGMLTAQDTFSDDFESYNVGDYVGDNSTQWSTWSGTTGGAEDMQVSNTQAKSGSNSAYLEGTAAGGGPQDVVLDFGGKRTTGTFTFTSSFLIGEGKGAYFNFQQEEIIGTAWAFDCYMRPGGNMDLIQPGITLAYPVGEWFEMKIEANLDFGVWTMSIDGDCIANFEMANAAVASLDLFPADPDYDFYVDDVSFVWEDSATDPGTAARDVEVGIENDGKVGIIGGNKAINVNLTNRGTDMITDVSLSYTINGTTNTQDVTGLSLATGAVTTVELENLASISDDITFVEVRATAVNGTAGDDQACNDYGSSNYNGFSPAPNKKVWAEEATGTWCPWCPRGDVFMNLMNERYKEYFVGIAVHNRNTDPMLNVAWDAGITSFNGFTGFPGLILERAVVMDPSAIENNLINYLQRTPNTTMVHEATFDENTRELVVGIHTNFAEQEIGAYKLVVGLTEDDVTGTSSGYAQFNNYAGGGNGPMGGFENLPNPVPASQMVYNHVGRELLTPFGGMENAFSSGSVVPAGWYYHEFTVTLDSEYDINNMHIISATIFTDGTTDNAQTSTINSAVNTIDVSLDAKIDISPNPSTGWTNIRVNLEDRSDLTIQVTDAMGKLISQRNYDSQIGDQIFPFDGSNLSAGIYYVRINVADKFTTRKLVLTN